MKVISAPGTRCPKENSPRDYITDTLAMDVPNRAYYRRLVREGSLLIEPSKPPAKAAPQKSPKSVKTKEVSDGV